MHLGPSWILCVWHLHATCPKARMSWTPCWLVGLKVLLHFAHVTAQEVGQSMAGRQVLSEQGPL